MYDQLFTMHGVTMVFWYASPILSGFSNYLIPLMIGSRDMAYPRLNAFSYWSFLFSAVLLYIGPCMGQAPHAGWFAYVPFTDLQYSPGHGMDFYALSLIFLSISTTVGAVNFIATILRLRAPGMSISKMPLLCYSTGTIFLRHHIRSACPDHGLRLPGARPALGHALLPGERWGKCADVAAVVLVFRPSLGLRNFHSCHGDAVDDDSCIFTASDRRVSVCGDLDGANGRCRI